MKSKLLEYRDKLQIELHESVLLILIFTTLLFTCYIFEYGDVKAYTTWGIDIWDACAQGRIKEYYTVSCENVNAWNSYPIGNTAFGILYLLPLAIWNLPLWVTSFFCGKMIINSPGCIFWSQLFFLVCSLITAIFTSKIVHHFTHDIKSAKTALIITLGAPSLMISIGYAGQDEIVYLASIVTGFYYYIVGREKTGIGLFLFGISQCNLMIIPVTTFLLFYEKNVIKIGTLIISPMLLERVVSNFCGKSRFERIATSQQAFGYTPFREEDIYQWFVGSNTRQYGIGVASLFVTIIVIISLFAYLKRFKDDEEKQYYSLVCVSIVFSIVLCFFAWEHAYRYYISVPINVAVVTISSQRKKDLSVGIGMLICTEVLRSVLASANDYIFRFDACCLGRWFDKHAIAGSLYTYIVEYFPLLERILRTPVVSCFFAFLLFQIIYCVQIKESSEISLSLVILEFVYSLLSFILLLLYFYLYFSFSITDYSIRDTDSLAMPINGMDSIFQSFTPQGSYVDFIDIRSVTWERDYPKNAFLSVDLLDNYAVLAHKNIQLNDLPNNNMIRIYMKTHVEAGKKYYFHFYSRDKIEDEEEWVYLLQSDETTVHKYSLFGILESGGKKGEEIPYNVISKISERF